METSACLHVGIVTVHSVGVGLVLGVLVVSNVLVLVRLIVVLERMSWLPSWLG